MRNLFLMVMCAGCTKDPDKLLGDSNVYAEPLEINEFNASQDNGGSSGSVPEIVELSATEHNGVIDIIHMKNGPCGHSWDKVTVDSSEKFLIEIDYGFEEDSLNVCLFYLEYEIDVSESELPAGLYKIKAMDDSVEIDLTEALSE